MAKLRLHFVMTGVLFLFVPHAAMPAGQEDFLELLDFCHFTNLVRTWEDHARYGGMVE